MLLINLALLVVTAGIASQKGFNPLLWILAGGIPGLLIVLCTPSAKEAGIDLSTAIARRKRGNIVGAVASVLVVIVGVLLLASA